MAKRQTFEEFCAEEGIPEITIQDQGPLSPSGRRSERSRQAWIKKEDERLSRWGEALRKYQGLINSGEVVDPTGRYWPIITRPKSEIEAEALIRRADELESLANRGMSPRKFRKEAAKLREQAKPRLSR